MEDRYTKAAKLLGTAPEELESLYGDSAVREAAAVNAKTVASILTPLVFPNAGFLTQYVVRKVVIHLFETNPMFKKLFSKIVNAQE